MTIQGHKEVDLRRDEPAPPGDTVQVVWFVPTREGGPRHPVGSLTALRNVLAPYRDHERLVVYLDRDGGESGSVWVHLTGDRAWVSHTTQPGGIDSYGCDPGSRDSGERIGFLLSNGQRDEIHRYWTVTRAEGFRALEYFHCCGEPDPWLTWADEVPSWEQPP